MDRKPTWLMGGSRCAKSGKLREPLNALQFAFKLYEIQRSQGTYFMHTHPKKSMTWHEEFVKQSSGEEHLVKVIVNMDCIAKPTSWLSHAPKIAKRSSLLQRSRQVHPKKLVAAIITGLMDQLRTIGWLNWTTVGIYCEEEPIELSAEDYDNICDTITGERLSPEALQTAWQEELEFIDKLAVLKEVSVEQCWLVGDERDTHWNQAG